MALFAGQSQGGFMFGSSAPTTAAATPFSFGLSGATAPAAGVTGFPVGSSFASPLSAPTSAPAAAGFSFGPSLGATATTAAPAPGFTFGSSVATPATIAPSSGFGFGSALTAPATTATTGFTFGSSLAAPATTVAAPGFTFGSSLANTATSAPAAGFTFGSSAAAPSTSAPATSFTFGSSLNQTTGAVGSTFNFGGASLLGQTATNAAGSGFSFGGAAAKAAGAGPPNLGGADPKTLALPGIVTSAAPRPDTKPDRTNKDADMPNELRQLVIEFRTFVAQQKQLAATFDRTYASRDLAKLDSESAAVQQRLDHTGAQLDKLTGDLDVLKGATITQMKNSYGLEKCLERPTHQQYETDEAQLMLLNDLSECEQTLLEVSEAVSDVEQQLVRTDDAAVSSDGVLQVLQALYAQLVANAAGHAAAHDRLAALKQRYLARHRAQFGDVKAGVVFPTASAPAVSTQTTFDGKGPSPFCRVGDVGMAVLAALMHPQPGATAAPPSMFAQPAAPTSVFGAAGTTQASKSFSFTSGLGSQTGSSLFGSGAASTTFGSGGGLSGGLFGGNTAAGSLFSTPAAFPFAPAAGGFGGFSLAPVSAASKRTKGK